MRIFERWRKTSISNKALVITGSLVAFSSLVYTGTAIFQAYIYKKQWEAMNQSVREIQISRELENQAFVGLKSGILVAPLHVGEWQKITILFVNSGRTPAFNVRVNQDWVLSATEPSDLTPKPVIQPVRQGNVTPGVDNAINFWLPSITAQDLDDIGHFRKFIYVFGVIEYEDIFGNHHWTKFCLQHHPTTQDMGFCLHGNETDYLRSKPN